MQVRKIQDVRMWRARINEQDAPTTKKFIIQRLHVFFLVYVVGRFRFYRRTPGKGVCCDGVVVCSASSSSAVCEMSSCNPFRTHTLPPPPPMTPTPGGIASVSLKVAGALQSSQETRRNDVHRSAWVWRDGGGCFRGRLANAVGGRARRCFMRAHAARRR